VRPMPKVFGQVITDRPCPRCAEYTAPLFFCREPGCNGSGRVPARPPYTGPIWRDYPTALDVITLPLACAWLGLALGLFALAAFVMNPMNEDDSRS
jgi:hypothetical protein